MNTTSADQPPRACQVRHDTEIGDCEMSTSGRGVMSPSGQKRPKLPCLLAAKSSTGQGVKFVPKGDIEFWCSVLRWARDRSRRRDVTQLLLVDC
jgi:hypothetical protein